jgi:hypothetical protein
MMGREHMNAVAIKTLRLLLQFFLHLFLEPAVPQLPGRFLNRKAVSCGIAAGIKMRYRKRSLQGGSELLHKSCIAIAFGTAKLKVAMQYAKRQLCFMAKVCQHGTIHSAAYGQQQPVARPDAELLQLMAELLYKFRMGLLHTCLPLQGTWS